MTNPRIIVYLEDDERRALFRLANVERRDPRQQAAYLIRSELMRLGLIQVDTHANYVASEEKSKEFEELARPLMEFLAKNFHPHMSIIITSTNAEMVEGVRSFVTDDFIKEEEWTPNEP